jgi:hypothetical protein
MCCYKDFRSEAQHQQHHHPSTTPHPTMLRHCLLSIPKQRVVLSAAAPPRFVSMMVQHPLDEMSPAVEKFVGVLEDYRQKKYVEWFRWTIFAFVVVF